MFTLVDAQTLDDVSYPAVGTGASLSSRRVLTFYPTISTGGQAKFIVLFFMDGEYKPCQSHTAIDNTPFEIELPNTADVNCYTTGITGTVSLKV